MAQSLQLTDEKIQWLLKYQIPVIGQIHYVMLDKLNCFLEAEAEIHQSAPREAGLGVLLQRHLLVTLIAAFKNLNSITLKF